MDAPAAWRAFQYSEKDGHAALSPSGLAALIDVLAPLLPHPADRHAFRCAIAGEALPIHPKLDPQPARGFVLTYVHGLLEEQRIPALREVVSHAYRAFRHPETLHLNDYAHAVPAFMETLRALSAKHPDQLFLHAHAQGWYDTAGQIREEGLSSTEAALLLVEQAAREEKLDALQAWALQAPVLSR